MAKLSFIVVILLSFYQLSFGKTSDQESQYDKKLDLSRDLVMLDTLLIEAKKSFTFKAKPIHPKIIKDFETWESDPIEAYRISYDINMVFDTNKYSNSEVTIADDGWNIIIDKNNLTTYQYRFIGALENELSIVVSQSVRGGFLLNYTLHALEFKIEQGLSRKDFKLYNRLVIKSYFQTRLDSINDIFISEKYIKNTNNQQY